MAIPDENIHPIATGNAAKTVAEHQAKQDLVFYSGWFCPFNQRVWVSLEEKGIPYQYKEVNPYKKEKHFLDINPKGLVPAIEYQGRALYESLVLCEYLEEAYPNHEPRLLPVDPFERAHAQSTEQQDAARQELYDAQRKLAQQVKGPYFTGKEFGLVDVANAPWVAREYILAEHRGYDGTQVGNGWSEYAERLATRESIIKTTSDEDKLQVIYDRYLRDEAQSEVAKALRAGRPLP
ncbi:glutathione S-transferase [Suillus subaureus]|uniref:Glutathione S-transferase n=1 Tax=Suillus subaureus TaxID=48587 RepID=A0A9P7EKP7_9AGAM|nr:glutathione S-transferase [Suillus subaureus]KAG1824434.1 glutathione S-transferase [Suillus subaureus]